MQIRINLHPQRGTRRGARALPVSGAALGRVLAPVRDKYLVGAVAAVLASCGAVAALHVSQQRASATLAAQEQTAVRDSAHFASVIAARAKAIARRDSLGRELRVISAIDSTRYVWAHVLDEVSRSLPPYTWLTNVTQTSAAPAPPTTVAGAAGKPAAGAKPAPGKPGLPVDTASAAMRFRVVGQTVDIQALTQFMRDLEASPFVRNVQLARSEPLQGGATQTAGREVTEFTLDAEFERAPREALRTVTLSVQVR